MSMPPMQDNSLMAQLIAAINRRKNGSAPGIGSGLGDLRKYDATTVDPGPPSLSDGIPIDLRPRYDEYKSRAWDNAFAAMKKDTNGYAAMTHGLPEGGMLPDDWDKHAAIMAMRKSQKKAKVRQNVPDIIDYLSMLYGQEGRK